MAVAERHFFAGDRQRSGGDRRRRSDATDPAIVHLMAMWVHPALRGSGAASALVQAVLAWAEGRGASSVRLDVIDGNDRARRLYERHGFQPTGHSAMRPRDGAREVQMEWRAGTTRAE